MKTSCLLVSALVFSGCAVDGDPDASPYEPDHGDPATVTNPVTPTPGNLTHVDTGYRQRALEAAIGLDIDRAIRLADANATNQICPRAEPIDGGYILHGCNFGSIGFSGTATVQHGIYTFDHFSFWNQRTFFHVDGEVIRGGTAATPAFTAIGLAAGGGSITDLANPRDVISNGTWRADGAGHVIADGATIEIPDAGTYAVETSFDLAGEGGSVTLTGDVRLDATRAGACWNLVLEDAATGAVCDLEAFNAFAPR
jgi:hypothetical protein